MQSSSQPAFDPTSASATTRRDAILSMTALGAAGLAMAAPALAQDAKPAGAPAAARAAFPSAEQLGWDPAKREYSLPKLAHPYSAFEPHIDAQTMEIHHSKHHAAYVAGLNKALKELEKIRKGEGDASLIKHWERELAFHGGGHANHTMFWLTLAPANAGLSGKPSEALLRQIEKDFGGFDAFMAQFGAAANAVEGGGWAWLMWEPMAQALIITQMEKQQEMYFNGARPLLGIDVWEHAYYLKYQNKRADYVKAWANLINWPAVDEFFARARGA